MLGILVLSALVGCGVEKKIASITVSPSSSTVKIGRTQQFYAAAYDSSNAVLSSTSFTWASDSSIGTIDASGLFYSVSSPSAGYITASSGGISGRAYVKVTDKGTISGKTSSQQGNAVANMLVFLTAVPTFSAFTNTTGDYSIEEIPFGTFEVSVRENLLYLKATSEVYVATGETKTLNFTLSDRLSIEDENISGDPITVSGKVRNNGTTEAKSVSISYLFYDADGNLSSSGSQSLGNIAASATAAFFLAPAPTISTKSSVTRTVAATSF